MQQVQLHLAEVHEDSMQRLQEHLAMQPELSPQFRAELLAQHKVPQMHAVTC